LPEEALELARDPSLLDVVAGKINSVESGLGL
jgi:hypothetical protein